MARKKKKNYFDNETVTAAIKEYQKGLAEGRDDIHLIYPYTEQIQMLVRGVINTHKIYRWWNDVDELMQEGMLAIYSSLKRFNPEKGTAFNYLSIVAKQHLKNWTQNKNKKAWNTSEYNDEIYQHSDVAAFDEHLMLQEMLTEMDVDESLETVLEGILDSISKQKLYNKRDITKYLLRQGYPKKDIDSIFNELEDHFGGTDE